MASRVRHLNLSNINTLEAYRCELASIYTNLDIDCFTVRIGDQRVLGVRKIALDALRARRPDVKLSSVAFYSFPKVLFLTDSGARRFLPLDYCTDVPSDWHFTDMHHHNVWISDAAITGYFDNAPAAAPSALYTFRAEAKDIDFARIGREAKPTAIALWIETDQQRVIMVREEHVAAFARLAAPNAAVFTTLYRNAAGVLHHYEVPPDRISASGWRFYYCPLPIPNRCLSKAQVARAVSQIREERAKEELAKAKEAAKQTIKVRAFGGAGYNNEFTRQDPAEFDFEELGQNAAPDVAAFWIESEKSRVVMIRKTMAEAIGKHLQWTPSATGIQTVPDGRWLTDTGAPEGEWSFSCARQDEQASWLITQQELAAAVEKAAKEKAAREAIVPIKVVFYFRQGGSETRRIYSSHIDIDFEALGREHDDAYAIWIESPVSRVVMFRRDKRGEFLKRFPLMPDLQSVAKDKDGWRASDTCCTSWCFSVANVSRRVWWSYTQDNVHAAVKAIGQAELDAAMVKVAVEAY